MQIFSESERARLREGLNMMAATTVEMKQRTRIGWTFLGIEDV
jgi:hypothetical protein